MTRARHELGDLRAVRLPGTPELWQLITPFKSELHMKVGFGTELKGISRLIVERCADGRLRIADELLAPTV